VIKRLFRSEAIPAAVPTYWRLMRFMLLALLVGGCGVGGVFLSLHMGWNGLAAICGLVAIVGIASGCILTMAQTVNVFFGGVGLAAAPPTTMATSTTDVV